MLRELYERLFEAYGPQGWWPADSPLEVAVGAILTQHTSWRQAEVVLEALRRRTSFQLDALLRLQREELVELCRPAGTPRVKARRLRHLLAYLAAQQPPGIEGLRQRPTGALRRELLDLHGVGEETADALLLYALDRPQFVIDGYTQRIVGRYLGEEPTSYRALQARLTAALPRRVSIFKDAHALFVRLGKEHCTARRPRCRTCPLLDRCREAAARLSALRLPSRPVS